MCTGIKYAVNVDLPRQIVPLKGKWPLIRNYILRLGAIFLRNV